MPCVVLLIAVEPWPLTGPFFGCVLYIFQMTSSIPDGISADDLQAFAENAPEDITDKTFDGPYGGLTKQQVEDACEKLIEQMNELCDHPQIAKSMLWHLNDIMLAWHSRTGIAEIEDGRPASVAGWLRDAGKFQAIANILATISCGPQDYLINCDD